MHMLLKETLRQVAAEQKAELLACEYGVEREELAGIKPNLPFAAVISGVRRCGKSTLLRQLAGRLGRFSYFNFEDTRVTGFEPSDFGRLDEVFQEAKGGGGHYLFDEIQNVPGWEQFARQGLDRKRKFTITGSNASLLSRELGTKLTGRHLNHELFPFSYAEMLAFTKRQKPGPKSFLEYLERGGFPAFLKYGRPEILRELLADIIQRDIAARYRIRSLRTLKDMALYLLSNVGKEFSYNSLKKAFSLGSVNTAISFVSYFEDSYLLFTMPMFDYSPKKQLAGPKKVYSIDNGLSTANSVSFSADKGRLLENLVFLSLRRKSKDIFYFKGSEGECDFLVKEEGKIALAVQACYELNEGNLQRETAGLAEAVAKFGLKKGLILTLAQEDEITQNGVKIAIKPAWKWLLGKKQTTQPD